MDCVPKTPETDVAITRDQVADLFRLGMPFQFVRELEDPENWLENHPRPASTDFRNNYLTLAEIYEVFDGWVSEYPRLVTRQQIGTTVQSRPIYAYRVSQSRLPLASRKSIVFTSLVHAREWVTGSIVLYEANELINRVLTRRDYGHLLASTDVYFIPVVNPDGYSYTWTNTRLWRKNRRQNSSSSYGVDINRNFPMGWGGQGSSGQTGSETYRGPSANSEPETQAQVSFINGLARPLITMDYHSYSQLVMWPWGYQSATIGGSTGSLFASLGLQMRNAIFNNGGMTYVQGPVYSTIYPASGVSVDQFYAARGTLAFTIEARDQGTYGFTLPTDQIAPTQDENYAAFEVLLRYAASVP